jgi:hypothetical protein
MFLHLLPIALGMGMIETRDPCAGHTIAGTRCPLHSAAHTDRFPITLEQVGDQQAGLSESEDKGARE